MHRAVTLLLCCAVFLPAPASAARGRANQLLRVVEPAGRTVASAHPFVNVEFRFGIGVGTEGTADPASFRARLGGVNVTPLFAPITENGVLVGVRAALGPALLVPGSHRANRLRAQVRGRSPKGRPIRDLDVLRFRAADIPDEAPVARALAESEVLLPDVPLQLDGTGSTDPEGDALDYHWDFRDGTTSEDAKPVHIFKSSAGDVTVRLTVSDGQLDGHDQVTMLAVPLVPAGRTPGKLKIAAPAPLEFAAVPLGQSGSLSFTVSNTDTDTPTSELIVRLGVNGAAFTLGTTRLDLGPGESAPVTLTFAPTASGHQAAEITAVASATNQTSVHFLSHGYGGAAPGTGPLPVAEAVFYSGLAGGTVGILPNGTRFVADTNVHVCLTPQNGPGFGDYCLTDADCAANNGSCALTGTCVRGDRAGQPCSTSDDCPNGFCPTSSLFDPIDTCGDGEGGLYLISDAGTYTDPRPNPDTELTGTLMHVRFDGNGNRVGAEIVERTTDGTEQIACDKIPASAGGQLYIAEDIAFTQGTCFRDTREALIAKQKSTGSEDVLLSRIDAVEGLDLCNDDFDPADDLQVARDGSAAFVALPSGLFRVRPTPLLMTPDEPDAFQVHPDGSVLIATSGDTGSTGLLRLYKISVDQAIHGAPHVSDLTPCATIEVPNNRGANPNRLTALISFAADPVAPGSGDATVLLSFFSGGGGDALPSSLRVRGTVAVTSPAGSAACNVIGLVNLEPDDQLTF